MQERKPTVQIRAHRSVFPAETPEEISYKQSLVSRMPSVQTGQAEARKVVTVLRETRPSTIAETTKLAVPLPAADGLSY